MRTGPIVTLCVLLCSTCRGAPAPPPVAPVPPLESSPAEPVGLPEVEELLADAGYRGAFVLSGAGGALSIAGLEQARERREPCSTFKIPNTLIGLETGVIVDEGWTLPWDGVERWLPAWNRDLDLAAALDASAVWYYQEVARRVGLERMNGWVARLGYGNAEVGSQVDLFWLDGPLLISPVEQVEFLTRLTAGELPVSPRSLEILGQVMPRRERDGSVVLAKTGTCVDGEALSHAWLVGWIEGEGGGVTSRFALLLLGDGRSFDEVVGQRWGLALEALSLTGALPPG